MINPKLNDELRSYYASSGEYENYLAAKGVGEAKANWQGYVKYVLRYLKEGSKVLELGGGVGTAAVAMRRKLKIKIISTDISPKFVKTAKKRKDKLDVRFEVADATSLKYKNESFDAVISFGLIEHIPDPYIAIREMVRVLKPEGLLVVVFPNWFTPLRYVKGLLSGKGEFFTENKVGFAGWALKVLAVELTKPLAPFPVYRQPKLGVSKTGYHSDEDMCYLAHRAEMRKWMEDEGCEVLRTVADTYRFSRFAWLAPYGGIIARRRKIIHKPIAHQP